MASKIKPVPEGYHTLTPALVVRGAAEAIEFYKKAFGAEEVCRMPGPDGKGVAHAEIRIGDSVVMLGDEWPNMNCLSPQTIGGTSVNLCLYVEDCDKVFNQAVAAGAKAVKPPEDMFWGDRYGKLADPFGHEWSVMTHKEDVPPEEMAQRAEKAMAEFASKS